MSGGLAGRLTERVAILRRDGARDAAGGAIGDWNEIGLCWAGFAPIAPGPPVAGEAASALPRWRVTVRAGAAVAVGDRLERVSGPVRVDAVTRDPVAPDRLTIAAEELR